MNKRRRSGRVEMTIGLLLIVAALLLTGYNLWDSYRAGQSSQDILLQLKIPQILRKAEDTPEWYSTLIGNSADPQQSRPHQPGNGSPTAKDPASSDIPVSSGTASPDNPLSGNSHSAISGNTEKIGSNSAAKEDTENTGIPFVPPESMPTQRINGLPCIGVLEVPMYNLTLPIINEWDDDKLQIAPCVYTGSYYNNDLVICGHNYSTHFSSLKFIPLDADIYFTTVDGFVYHYIVDNVETVNPTEIERMIVGDNWDLTLFTCHTGGTTRCAIRCIRSYD